jgi:hypothetical protein
MDKQTYADATALVFGTPDALDHIDAIVAALIVGYIVARRPPWGKADRVALVAIAALAEHAPDVARQLIDELHG